MTTPRPIIMAAGVQFQEQDLRGYVRELTNNKLAVIGPAQKGEKNKVLLLTSLSQTLDKLGIPNANFPALQALREYFNAGGGRAHYVRVANGDAKATATITFLDNTTDTIAVPTSGSYFNGQTVDISHSLPLVTQETETHTFTTSTATYNTPALSGKPLVANSVRVYFGSTLIAKDNGAGTLIFETSLAEHAKYSGTVNYITGVVSITTTSLTTAVTGASVKVSALYWSAFNFQVNYVVKDSDGNPVGSPYRMENHRNLTLANMVGRLAGSKFLDIPTAFTKFPLAGTLTFSGGDDGADDLTDADYIGNTLGVSPTGLQMFAFPDQIDINLVAIPGASSSLAVRQSLIQFCEVQRSDTLALIDPPKGLDIQGVADWANGNGAYSAYDSMNTTYAATYYPHFTTYNSLTNEEESTPPCAAALAAFARTNPWEAPAGPERGKLLNITGVDVVLNPNDRAFLAENRINPISDLAGLGTMVLGQQTATTQASSLDRIGARMMLMRIEKAITTVLYALLFKENTPRTWNRAMMLVQPYLDSLVQKERIYAGQFICNDKTNDVDTIEQNIMAATCRLQLLKFAEIIIVTFLIDKTGGQINEQVISQNYSV